MRYRLSVVIVLCCYLCYSVIIVLFYVLSVCTVTLPPGVNPIAVDKYIYLSNHYLSTVQINAFVPSKSHSTLTVSLSNLVFFFAGLPLLGGPKKIFSGA